MRESVSKRQGICFENVFSNCRKHEDFLLERASLVAWLQCESPTHNYRVSFPDRKKVFTIVTKAYSGCVSVGE